jgi:1-acyl-sn-glycerol-3-phosphate acyltransferase
MRDLLRRQWRELRLNLRPRELAYWLVQNLLLLIFRFTMRVQLFGGEHYAPPAPATLLLSNHKRDWDPLLCAISLYYQRGWWRPDGRRMAFVGREDMFTRGFLAEIAGYREWPLWTKRLLDHTTLTRIIGPLRAYPIVRFLEFSLRQYLFELYREQGDLPLVALFSDDFLDQLDRWAEIVARRSRRFKPRPSRELRVSDILTWHYRERLMDRLQRGYLLPEPYEAYKARQRAKIARQVRALAGALAAGDSLWLAPEGMITQDGAPRRVRDGLHALLDLLPPGVRILPISVTYDFMTTDRMRACVSVGPPLEGLAGLARAEVGQRVMAAITRQTVATMSMIGSRFLWNRLQAGQPTFDLHTASSAVAQDVQLLTERGALIERGLRDEHQMRKRLRAFLAYSLRHGLISRTPNEAYQINPAPFQQQRDTFFWLNPRYCVNELVALEDALASALLVGRNRYADQSAPPAAGHAHQPQSS